MATAPFTVSTGVATERISTGTGTEAFVGSLLTGRIYTGDLRTGAGRYLQVDGTGPRR